MQIARHSTEPPVAELKGISKSFADKPVLRDISLAAYPGEIVLVRGQSGSGKSTALRILAGIEKPDEGSIHIFGDDVTDLPPKKRQRLNARKVGLGFQEPLLDKGFSVQDNLVGLGESFGKRDPKRIGLIAVKFGLADKLHEQAAILSGGEKQKLALGRLFVPRPELILLDEPTAAIDPTGKRGVYETIRDFSDTEGSTVIIISHDEQAIDYADRIVQIESGSLVESQSTN